jgi:hypothetical protein
MHFRCTGNMSGSTISSTPCDPCSNKGSSTIILDRSAHTSEQRETLLTEALMCSVRSEQYWKEEAGRHAALIASLEEENDDLSREIQEEQQWNKEEAGRHAASIAILEQENDDVSNEIQEEQYWKEEAGRHAAEDLQGMSEKLARCEEKNAKLVEQRDDIAEKFHAMRQGVMTEGEVKEVISLAKAEGKCKYNMLMLEQQRTHAIMKRLQAENGQMQQEIERHRNQGHPSFQRKQEEEAPVSPARRITRAGRRASALSPRDVTREAAQATKEWINSAVDLLSVLKYTDDALIESRLE